MTAIVSRVSNVTGRRTFGYLREPDGSASHAFVAVGDRDPTPVADAVPPPPASDPPDPTANRPHKEQSAFTELMEDDEWLDGLNDDDASAAQSAASCAHSDGWIRSHQYLRH
jgi:hypothetical protein